MRNYFKGRVNSSLNFSAIMARCAIIAFLSISGVACFTGVGAVLLSPAAQAHDRVPPGHCCPVCGKICGCPLTVACGAQVRIDDSCIPTTMADVIRDRPRGNFQRSSRAPKARSQEFEAAASGKAVGRSQTTASQSLAPDNEGEGDLLAPPSTVDFGSPQKDLPSPVRPFEKTPLVLPPQLVDPNARENRPLLFR